MTARLSPLRALLAAGSVVAALLGVLVACSEAEDDTNPDSPPALVLSEAAVALPAGANTAIYLTIANEGAGGDRLVEVRTPVSDRVELHESRADDDGLMRMFRLEEIEVPGDSVLSLAPGGLHVMVYDVEALTEGDEVEVTFVFERSGEVVAEVPVRSYEDLIEGDAEAHDH